MLAIWIAPATSGADDEDVHVYTNEDLERFRLRPVSEVVIDERPAAVTTVLLLPQANVIPIGNRSRVADSQRKRLRTGSTFARIRSPRRSQRRPYFYRSMRVSFE